MVLIIADDMSFCTSLRNFIQIGPPTAEKQEALLSQRGRAMLRVCHTSTASSSDFRRRSGFVPSTPAFDAPVRGGGSCRTIAMAFDMEKLKWFGYSM